MLPFGFADARILLVTLPKIQKKAKAHKIHLVRREVEMG
jgi:hypothetical protein